jgi:transcriptional regulator with XRE-family HTH domain
MEREEKSKLSELEERKKSLGLRVEGLIVKAGGVGRLADLVGVSETTIRKWKSGESEPTASRLVQLAESSGVDIRWLATGEGAALSVEKGPGTTVSPEAIGLTIEDVQAIVTIVEGSTILKDAPIQERARVWMELINSQLKNRARLRAEALEMLKAGPPQPD